MEFSHIPNLTEKICRVGLGTWAIGGWLWGGTDEKEAIKTIHKAFDLGMNLVDTAPVYGFGVAERILGKAIQSYGKRESLIISTKAGISWKEGEIFRDSSKKKIFQEVDESLQRLMVDVIDLYHIHWPDFQVPFSETAEAMQMLMQEGKIRAIGVSNFNVEMMQEFMKKAPIHALQVPYNIFETEIEQSELPFCKKKGISVLGYGVLCRGLLTGKIHPLTPFKGDDLRKVDPKFQKPRFSQYLECVEKLKKWVDHKYGRSILALSVRYALDKGIEFPLWGARQPSQLTVFPEIWGWQLIEEDFAEISTIIVETIKNPVGAEFMEPTKEMKIKSR